jgi:hypothetical protein
VPVGGGGRGRARPPLRRGARRSPPAPSRRVAHYPGRVARLLIIGGGCRGLGLARELARDGHAARIVTRGDLGRPAIERAGAECWIGDPDRLGTLRGALEGVTIACWLLGTARGPEEQVCALHGSRLRAFLEQAIDSTMRGFLYEAVGSVPSAILADGERLAVGVAARNAIPLVALRADPGDGEAWQRDTLAAVRALLEGKPA